MTEEELAREVNPARLRAEVRRLKGLLDIRHEDCSIDPATMQ